VGVGEVAAWGIPASVSGVRLDWYSVIFPPGRTIWRPQLVVARGCSVSLSVLSPEGEAGRCCRYGVAVDVERAATLYAQGRSLRQIAAERGVHWSMEHQGRMLARLGLEKIDGHIAYEIAVL
jgi:hypothetical protein